MIENKSIAPTFKSLPQGLSDKLRLIRYSFQFEEKKLIRVRADSKYIKENLIEFLTQQIPTCFYIKCKEQEAFPLFYAQEHLRIIRNQLILNSYFSYNKLIKEISKDLGPSLVVAKHYFHDFFNNDRPSNASLEYLDDTTQRQLSYCYKVIISLLENYKIEVLFIMNEADIDRASRSIFDFYVKSQKRNRFIYLIDKYSLTEKTESIVIELSDFSNNQVHDWLNKNIFKDHSLSKSFIQKFHLNYHFDDIIQKTYSLQNSNNLYFDKSLGKWLLANESKNLQSVQTQIAAYHEPPNEYRKVLLILSKLPFIAIEDANSFFSKKHLSYLIDNKFLVASDIYLSFRNLQLQKAYFNQSNDDPKIESKIIDYLNQSKSNDLRYLLLKNEYLEKLPHDKKFNESSFQVCVYFFEKLDYQKAFYYFQKTIYFPIQESILDLDYHFIEMITKILYKNFEFTSCIELVDLAINNFEINQAKSLIEYKLECLKNLNRLEDCINFSSDSLKAIGHPVKLINTKWRQITDGLSIMKYLILRNEKKILELQPVGPEKEIYFNIFQRLGPVVHIQNPDLISLLLIEQLKFISKNGHSQYSSTVFANLGLVFCGYLANFKKAFFYESLSTKILNKQSYPKATPQTLFCNEFFINHWRQDPKETIKKLHNIKLECLKFGNFEYASYCLLLSIQLKCTITENMLKELANLRSYLKELLNYRQNAIINYASVIIGTQQAICSLPEESEIIIQDSPDRTLKGLSLANVIEYNYLREKIDITKIIERDKLENVGVATNFQVRYKFFKFLSLIRIHFNGVNVEQQFPKSIKKIKSYFQRCSKWGNIYYDIKSEIVTGFYYLYINKIDQGMTILNKGLIKCENRKYNFLEALTIELISHFYSFKNENKLASIYHNSINDKFKSYGLFHKRIPKESSNNSNSLLSIDTHTLLKKLFNSNSIEEIFSNILSSVNKLIEVSEFHFVLLLHNSIEQIYSYKDFKLLNKNQFDDPLLNNLNNIVSDTRLYHKYIYPKTNSGILAIPLFKNKSLGGIFYINGKDKEQLFMSDRIAFFNLIGEIIFTHINSFKIQKGLSSLLDETSKQSEQINKSYSERLIGAEAERKEIAVFLHNSVTTLLSAASRNLRLENQKTKELDEVQNFISEANEKLRKLSHQLYPPVLLKLGLIDAIWTLCQKFSTEKLKFHFDIKGIEQSIPKYKQTSLYNIISELINNIIKHSEANEAHISFNFEKEKIEIEVFDNGIGFMTDDVKENYSLGLNYIRSRIHELGDKVYINSNKTDGTKIILEINI